MIALRTILTGLAAAILALGALGFDFFPTQVDAALAIMLDADVAGVLTVQYVMKEEMK